MSFDDEYPPRRPGTGPQEHAEPDGAVEVEPGGEGPEEPLPALIARAVLAVEAVWGEIDPRSMAPDRLQVTAGPCPELLAAFFAVATTLMNVMNDIVDRLDDAEERAVAEWKPPTSLPEWLVMNQPRDISRDEAVRQAKDRLIAKMIDILGKAGVEVDEADVDSWTREQRQEAMKWATAQRHAAVLNPYQRPSFLPEV